MILLPVSICGRRPPSTVKTSTETMATMTRNVVPHRGWSVVFLRAFSTVRASPAS